MGARGARGNAFARSACPPTAHPRRPPHNGRDDTIDARPSEWVLWQLADSAFPAGGFAHSNGLESAFRSGLLRGADDLAGFLKAALVAAARGSAPFTAATCNEPRRFPELDALCDVTLSNPVANRASRAQGQAMLAATGRVYGAQRLLHFATLARRDRSPAHLAPVFGVVASALGLGAHQACSLYLFMSLRGHVSAAVRLGIVGPFEAQSLQADLAAGAAPWVDLACLLNPLESAQTMPLLDLAQGTHDRLYSRLFQS